MVRFVVVLVLCLALFGRGEPAFAQAVGTRVIDGHTLEIAGTIVRLFGIEAPETDQLCAVPEGRWSCGEFARAALQDLVRGRAVTCTPVSGDLYTGVTIAHCEAAGRDLGVTMVAGGWALALQRATRDYVPQEARARAVGAGLWRDNTTSFGYRPEIR